MKKHSLTADCPHSCGYCFTVVYTHTLSVKCVVLEMPSGWREFDDSKVREINESCITTKAAYVLFYRRHAASVSTVPPAVSPASVPTAVSAPLPSESAGVPQPTAADPVSSSPTAASANRKTVTPVPPAAAEFNETDWQTDMEAIDWCHVSTNV